MPSLVTYERKRLTEAQYHALGVYITRKRLREEANQNGTASNDIDKQTSPSQDDDTPQEVISNSPVKPSAREIREQKQQELNDTVAQLAELESMLIKLKEKKHEFFEEVKGLLHSKKHEERKGQMQGFPSPFMHHPGISPGAPMINISPFRPAGMKRPKSPSPPLVQLYSPLSTPSNIRPAFPPMGPNRMPGPPENLNPGYQFQQNYPPRDTHQPMQGPRVNPPPNPPRPTVNPFPPHDRTFPPFGASQVPGHPPRPPPPPASQPPFPQQKKRESHGPPNRSRYH